MTMDGAVQEHVRVAKMSLRLYELANEYKFLQDSLFDSETGEINESAMNRLNELDKPIQDKCINTVRAMKSLEAEYKAIEQERKAMQAREKALKDQVEWIKGYLLANMEKSEIKEISCPQFVIKLRKNPESVEIFDEDSIPEEYTQIEIKISKEAIKLAISGGIEVPGARLIQKNSLSIK
jgi:hypothetical protein